MFRSFFVILIFGLQGCCSLYERETQKDASTFALWLACAAEEEHERKEKEKEARDKEIERNMPF